MSDITPTMSVTFHNVDIAQANEMAMVIDKGKASATKAKPASKPRAKPAAKAEEPVTLETVKSALTAYRNKYSKEDAELIIKATGASSLSKIPEDQFERVVKLTKMTADKLKEELNVEEDDDEEEDWD